MNSSKVKQMFCCLMNVMRIIDGGSSSQDDVNIAIREFQIANVLADEMDLSLKGYLKFL